jgi:hypothetical protein
MPPAPHKFSIFYILTSPLATSAYTAPIVVKAIRITSCLKVKKLKKK